jgi:hypothetical protein
MKFIGDGLQLAIDGGLGGSALDNPVLIGALQLLDRYTVGMTYAEAQSEFYDAYGEFAQQSAQMAVTGQMLQDQEADVEKTGSGFTPIISVNIQPSIC